jgi:hypothetical protein
VKLKKKATKKPNRFSAARSKFLTPQPLCQELPSAQHALPQNIATVARQRVSLLLKSNKKGQSKAQLHIGLGLTTSGRKFPSVTVQHERTMQCNLAGSFLSPSGTYRRKVSYNSWSELGAEPKSRRGCRQAWGRDEGATFAWFALERKIIRRSTYPPDSAVLLTR